MVNGRAFLGELCGDGAKQDTDYGKCPKGGCEAKSTLERWGREERSSLVTPECRGQDRTPAPSLPLAPMTDHSLQGQC